jgi:hypothetical protein
MYMGSAVMYQRSKKGSILVKESVVEDECEKQGNPPPPPLSPFLSNVLARFALASSFKRSSFLCT